MNRFGLIGGNLSHSYSPAIHAMLGDYPYALYPLARQELDAFMRENDLAGFNVTIPYKTDALRYCKALSGRARAVGSVNTVLRRMDGSYFGDNTDYAGFRELLGQDAERLRGKKAIVLGSGGASLAVCSVLLECGIPPVVISRSGPENYTNIARHLDAALIVNATPVGMYPDNEGCPLDPAPFTNCRLILDLIYNPAKTTLLLQAEKLGIPARNGLLMLCAQAAAAGGLFTGRLIPPEKAYEITEEMTRRMKNVALIGMPGCGKTSVGKELARLTGRRLLGTDEMVVNAAGMTIPELFEKKGEAFFREMETRALRSAARESGCVITTGGGVVTVPCNRDILMQNSVTVLIERDLDSLATDSRPMFNLYTPKELYLQRRDLYIAWSEWTVRNDTPLSAAEQIRQKLGI